MEKSIHKGHRERLRRKVAKMGLDNFEEHEILEYILTFVIPQKDTNPIAHRLINTFGSIKNVLEADPKDLVKVKGIGEITALFINTYLGVLYHYEKYKDHKDIIINTPSDAGEYFKSLLYHKTEEEVYMATLDEKNKITQTIKLADGSYNEVEISPRDILNMIFRNNSKNIILCHNHPSGKPVPSTSDNKFTRDLLLSLMLNNISLLDHVIIGKDGYYSYKASDKIHYYIKENEKLLSDRKIQEEYSIRENDDDKMYIPYRRDKDDKK